MKQIKTQHAGIFNHFSGSKKWSQYLLDGIIQMLVPVIFLSGPTGFYPWNHHHALKSWNWRRQSLDDVFFTVFSSSKYFCQLCHYSVGSLFTWHALSYITQNQWVWGFTTPKGFGICWYIRPIPGASKVTPTFGHPVVLRLTLKIYEKCLEKNRNAATLMPICSNWSFTHAWSPPKWASQVLQGSFLHRVWQAGSLRILQCVFALLYTFKEKVLTSAHWIPS